MTTLNPLAHNPLEGLPFFRQIGISPPYVTRPKWVFLPKVSTMDGTSSSVALLFRDQYDKPYSTQRGPLQRAVQFIP